MNSRNLKDVLSPVTSSNFFSDFWCQKPFHVSRNNPDYFQNLLSLEDLDGLLFGRDSKHFLCDVVKEGEYLHRTTRQSDAITHASYLELYEDGATLIFQQLHRDWYPLAELCRSLEFEFNLPVQTNIYLTPPESTGFAPHLDTHDVIILQTHGCKRWKIYPPTVECPVRGMGRKLSRDELDAPIRELTLCPGDTLYIPRGFIHEGESSHQPSLHITVGLIQFTWMDVFSKVMEKMSSIPSFRKSLPADYLKRPGNHVEVITDGFNSLFSEIINTVDLPDVMNSIQTSFVSSRRPLLRGSLELSKFATKVTERTRLRKVPSILFQTDTTEEFVNLIFYDVEVSFPRKAEAELLYIFQTAYFCSDDLPGRLDQASQLVLIRRLIKDGFLEISACKEKDGNNI